MSKMSQIKLVDFLNQHGIQYFPLNLSIEVKKATKALYRWQHASLY